MSNTRFWAVIICIWYHDHEDGTEGDVLSRNHSWLNTITKGTSWHCQRCTAQVSGDKLSSKEIVITEIRSLTRTEGAMIKSSHCSRWWKEPGSNSNPLSDITSEEHLKISLRIESSKITSLIYTRDWSVYARTQVDTSRVRTAQECRGFRQFAFRIGQVQVNPHIHYGFSLLSTWEYRLPGAELSQHWRCTLRGNLKEVVFRWRNVIFVYSWQGLWHRFDWESLEASALESERREQGALVLAQGVESYDKTRKERD